MTSASKQTSRARLLLASAAAGALLAAPAAMALPQGGVVVAHSPVGQGPAATIGTTGNTTTVDQNTEKVVIDWRSFNVADGETVNFQQDAANWIAFNRINAQQLTNINGAINATGGVWLFAPGGMLFGANARVNVGSFGASTGRLADDQLDEATSGGLIRVSPHGRQTRPGLTVSNGAQINADAGYVVLHGERIAQGGAITATDSILYDLGDTFDVNWQDNGSALQLTDGFSTLQAGRGHSQFTHSGSSQAGGFVQMTAHADTSSTSQGVINLSGTLAAQGLRFGTDGVFLIAPGLAVDTTHATITAASSVEVLAASATVGRISTGAELEVSTTGDIVVEGLLQAGAGEDLSGGVALTSGGGDITINEDIDSADQVFITASAGDVTIGDGVTVNSDSDGFGYGPILINAGGNVTAAANSVLRVGCVDCDPFFLDTIQIVAGATSGQQASAGGNITLGTLLGGEISLTANGGATAGGRVTLNGPITATDSLEVLSDSDAGGPEGGIRVLGDVTSEGAISLVNLTSGTVEIGAGVDVAAGGDDGSSFDQATVQMFSGGDIVIGQGAQVTGAAGVALGTLSRLVVEDGASIASLGQSDEPNELGWPVYGDGGQSSLSLNGDVRITAADIDLRGNIRAGSGENRRDIHFDYWPNATGAFVGGAEGDAGEGAWHLSDAEFQRLEGRAVLVKPGVPLDGGDGDDQVELVEPSQDDLLLGDLTLDGAKISELWLGTTGRLGVVGDVKSSSSAAVNLRLGFLQNVASGGEGEVVEPLNWVPAEIAITGSLGGSGALGQVSMASTGDILMGSEAYVNAAREDPEFDPLADGGELETPGADHLFVQADSLQLASTGRILQQNTAGTQGGFAGLLVGLPTAERPLIVAPEAFDGVFGGDGGVGDFTAGPTLIDLYGTFVSQTGNVTGAAAATVENLLDPRIAVEDMTRYRINCAQFGGGGQGASCGGIDPELQLFIEQLVLLLLEIVVDYIDSAQPSVGLVALPEYDPEEEDDAIAMPITGTGNEDLWSGPSLEEEREDDEEDREQNQ